MTRKQQKFIDEYVKCLNGSQAARNAGYSNRTANAIASENLQKPYIKKAIDEKIAQNEAKYKLTKDDFIKKTIELHSLSNNPSVKARYWELLAKLCSYTDENKAQTLCIFSNIEPLITKRIGKAENSIQLIDTQRVSS